MPGEVLEVRVRGKKLQIGTNTELRDEASCTGRWEMSRPLLNLVG